MIFVEIISWFWLIFCYPYPADQNEKGSKRIRIRNTGHHTHFIWHYNCVQVLYTCNVNNFPPPLIFHFSSLSNNFLSGLMLLLIPDVLLHIIGGDQVSADIADLFPFPLITSALVRGFQFQNLLDILVGTTQSGKLSLKY